MRTALLLEDIHLRAFKNLGNLIVRSYFRVFAWFSFAIFFIVLYSLVLRVFIGYQFD